MSERTNREKPEVYALRQDGGTWQISRRDFLKTAGIGAAALGAGLNSRLVRPAEAEDLSKLCKETSAHPDEIKKLMVSPDGKYLVSYSNGMVKCWDFDNYSLLGLRKVSVSDHYGNFLTVGMYRGKQCLLFKLSNENRIDAVELPAMETSPFALEYCSFVRRSVMVAVNAGSRSAEKTELTITPR